MDPRADLEKPFRASVLFSWAAVATLLIYAAIVEIIKSALSPYPSVVRPSGLQTERYFLYGTAIIVVILIRVLVPALTKKRSGQSRDFYYLLFVSLVLEFMYFPRKSAWEAMIRNAYQQSQNENG